MPDKPSLKDSHPWSPKGRDQSQAQHAGHGWSLKSPQTSHSPPHHQTQKNGVERSFPGLYGTSQTSAIESRYLDRENTEHKEACFPRGCENRAEKLRSCGRTPMRLLSWDPEPTTEARQMPKMSQRWKQRSAFWDNSNQPSLSYTGVHNIPANPARKEERILGWFCLELFEF